MNLSAYQRKARTTAIYTQIDDTRIIYPALGLLGECGELADKIKKITRDDGGEITPDKKESIKKECGDIMWYCANLCCEMDSDLEVMYKMRGHFISQQIKKLPLPRLIFRLHQHAAKAVELLECWHYQDQGSPNKIGRYVEVHNNLTNILVCIAEIAQKYGYTLEEICIANIEKLAGRKRRGTLGGSGDDR